MTVTFKIQNGIHHMLQNSRACNCSLFRNVTNNKNRYIHPLRHLHQDVGRLSHLGNAPGCRADRFIIHRLDRVNYHHLRLLSLNNPADQFQIGFT